MNNRHNDFEKRIRQLSNEDLIEMIEVKFEDFTEEAIKIARHEAENRGGIKGIKESLIQQRKLAEQRRQEVEEGERAGILRRERPRLMTWGMYGSVLGVGIFAILSILIFVGPEMDR